MGLCDARTAIPASMRCFLLLTRQALGEASQDQAEQHAVHVDSSRCSTHVKDAASGRLTCEVPCGVMAAVASTAPAASWWPSKQVGGAAAPGDTNRKRKDTETL